MEIKFTVQLLPEAFDFIESAEEKAREKIYYNIRKAQVTNDSEVFKKLNENIWEFRTLYNGKAYRVFAFWDKTGNQTSLVLATHGIIKKDRQNTATGNKERRKYPKGIFEKQEIKIT